MNSVCRNILLNIIRDEPRYSDYDDQIRKDDDEDNPMNYNPFIKDTLDEIENPKELQLTSIESALEKMKAAGGHCYEMLTLFWYHQKSMKDLTSIFGYTNEVNTRNQKSRCQERLRKLSFNELNN
jgi:hypothetical protein